MIATIEHVWPGSKVTTVIAEDCDTGRVRTCFVYMPEQQVIAAICERVSRHGDLGVTRVRPELIGARVIVMLKPPTRWGYQIETIELLPTLAPVSPDAHLGATER